MKKLTGRINVRLNEETENLWRDAAEFNGFDSLTDFVKYAVNKVIADENDLTRALESLEEYKETGKSYTLEEMKDIYKL